MEYLKTIDGLVCCVMMVSEPHNPDELTQWYGGAPLKKAVGDYVVSKGVNVFQLYAR